MAYKATVVSQIDLATTAVQSANLGTTMFASAHNFFAERTQQYSSFQSVRDSSAILSSSAAYQAAKVAFTAGAEEIYLGRRAIDSATYTPQSTRIGKVTVYSITVSTGTDSVTATYTSTTSDDAETIVTALEATITASDVDVTATVVGTTTAATLVIADSTAVNHVVSSSAYLDVEFTATEDASTLINALIDESGEDWYYVTAEDKSETFVLAMAAEIEATDSSDFPKQYHVSVAESTSLTTLADPAVDILGKLTEFGYTRTAGYWHHNANTVFPEVYCTARVGQYQAGSTTWKFVIPSGIQAARDPSTGVRLTTTQQGYIADRNASWFAAERGVIFNHGGTMAVGRSVWIDVQQLRDWINDRIETRLLTLLLNQVGGKIQMTEKGARQVYNVIEGVLKEVVDFGGFSGYVMGEVPATFTYEDQVNRILDNVEWTGYIAGAVHFISSRGVMTYETATLDDEA